MDTAAAAAKGAESIIHTPGLIPKKKRNVDHHSKIDEFMLGTNEETKMVKDLFETVNQALGKSSGDSPRKKKQRSIAEISANLITLRSERDSLLNNKGTGEEIEEVEELIRQLRQERLDAMK